MSSIRNSLHRRNHKERGQLANRKRLGILEKHKDYVLRARDFNEKKEKIKRLKQKAAERNKDEFYFGMVGRKTQVSSQLSLLEFSNSQLEWRPLSRQGKCITSNRSGEDFENPRRRVSEECPGHKFKGILAIRYPSHF